MINSNEIVRLHNLKDYVAVKTELHDIVGVDEANSDFGLIMLGSSIDGEYHKILKNQFENIDSKMYWDIMYEYMKIICLEEYEHLTSELSSGTLIEYAMIQYEKGIREAVMVLEVLLSESGVLSDGKIIAANISKLPNDMFASFYIMGATICVMHGQKTEKANVSLYEKLQNEVLTYIENRECFNIKICPLSEKPFDMVLDTVKNILEGKVL